MKIVKVEARRLDYQLIVDEARDWFVKHYNINPDVKVKFANHPGSSGWNMGGWYIKINAGWEEKDFNYVIDHEFSHSIAGTKHAHDDVFSEALFKVTKQRKHDVQYMLRREVRYKPLVTKRTMRRHRIDLEK